MTTTHFKTLWPADAEPGLEEFLDYLAKLNLGNGVWVGEEIETDRPVEERAFPLHVSVPNGDREPGVIVFETYPHVATAYVYEHNADTWTVRFPTREALPELASVDPVVLEQEDERPPVDTAYVYEQEAPDPDAG